MTNTREEAGTPAASWSAAGSLPEAVEAVVVEAAAEAAEAADCGSATSYDTDSCHADAADAHTETSSL